ncbi:alpha-2-macroglobulin family protein [Rubritalea tangerina]|uniref:alpha-2-macroglobulin family protein n=1 Tax=Rubritalea tangerina TaxID=430798 RepID=UPI0036134CCC
MVSHTHHRCFWEVCCQLLSARHPHKYRVIALAYHEADCFGSNTGAFTVKKDLMLVPKPPRFANEGDHLETKVLVENTSTFEGTWEVSLKADSLCKLPDSTNNTLVKTINLKANGSATLSFPAKFINTGDTTWTWSATPVALNNAQLNTH